MRFTVRSCSITAVVLALLVAACGGSDARDRESAQRDDNTTDRSSVQFVSLQDSGTAAMAAESFTATFTVDLDVDGPSARQRGTMAFRAPGDLHLVIDIGEFNVETLLLGVDVYVRNGHSEWASIGEEIFDREAYERYLEGPADYGALISGLESVVRLPDESRGGIDYEVYEGTYNPSTDLDTLPRGILRPAARELAEELSVQASFKVWLNPLNQLPLEIQADLEVDVAGESVKAQTTWLYSNWNQPVDIPKAPVDARPLSELTGGLTLEDLAYMMRFDAWVSALSDDFDSIDEVWAKSPHLFSSDDQEAWRTVIDSLPRRKEALGNLDPTERFRTSHTRYVEAMEQYEILYSEMKKELEDPGSADQDMLVRARVNGYRYMSNARELYEGAANLDE